MPRPCSFPATSTAARSTNTLNQNGNGLMIVGGLRGVTSPVQEFINDARLMRKFEFGSQTQVTATIGYYVANASNDFSRYPSSALLDVQNNAPARSGGRRCFGQRRGTVTDHGIYRYGYEWANANGESTTTAFYPPDEW